MAINHLIGLWNSAQSMAHMPQNNPGAFKDHGNNFLIGPPVKYHTDSEGNKEKIVAANPTATIEGLWEFIDTWLSQKEKPIHYVHFKARHQEFYLSPVNFKGESGLWFSNEVSSGENHGDRTLQHIF